MPQRKGEKPKKAPTDLDRVEWCFDDCPEDDFVGALSKSFLTVGVMNWPVSLVGSGNSWRSRKQRSSKRTIPTTPSSCFLSGQSHTFQLTPQSGSESCGAYGQPKRNWKRIYYSHAKCHQVSKGSFRKLLSNPEGLLSDTAPREKKLPCSESIGNFPTLY